MSIKLATDRVENRIINTDRSCGRCQVCSTIQLSIILISFSGLFAQTLYTRNDSIAISGDMVTLQAGKVKTQTLKVFETFKVLQASRFHGKCCVHVK